MELTGGDTVITPAGWKGKVRVINHAATRPTALVVDSDSFPGHSGWFKLDKLRPAS